MMSYYEPSTKRDEWRVMSQLERSALDTRVSILTRLEHYRDQQIDSYRHGSPPYRISPDNAIKMHLLREIHQLSALVVRLEKKQDDKRLMRWLISPIIALLSHFIYMELYKLPQFQAWTPWREVNDRGQHRPAYLTMFGLVPWITIPAAAYRIFSLEKRRSRTARLQDSLEDLADDVKCDVPVPYIGWLKTSKWNRIDWDE